MVPRVVNGFSFCEESPEIVCFNTKDAEKCCTVSILGVKILPKELVSESTTVLQASTLFQHVTWYFRKSCLILLQRSLRTH